MFYTTLILPAALAEHLHEPNWVVMDCRFTLAEPAAGQNRYLQAHIPGAGYAHLDRDLSSQVIPGVTGRHPLPSSEVAAQRFSQMGIGDDTQVVVYDDAGGALAAVRLWWMLRWLGHEVVAVLDGGWQGWRNGGFPNSEGEERRQPRPFTAHPRPELVASTAEVDALRLDPAFRLLDARSAERFRGENETIDPVAGHIPGAISAPYAQNLTAEGMFKPPQELCAIYQPLLNGLSAGRAVLYCGSGVTSIHDILAMLHAGLGEARLYAGSWSEWITDPARAVER